MKNKIQSTLPFVIICFMYSCNTSPSNTSKEKEDAFNNLSNSTSESTPSRLSNNKAYYIGETLDNGNWKFTVLSFKEDVKFKECKPESDDQIIDVLEILFENTSNETINNNFWFPSISDNEGREFSQSLCFNGEPSPTFNSGALASGKKRRGYLSFQVPKTSKKFELRFNPDATSLANTAIYSILLYK